MEVDFQMRTKWIEMMRNDNKSMTEAVKACRTKWVSLFSGLHDRQEEVVNQERHLKRGRRVVARIDIDPKSGKDICSFYNKGKRTFDESYKLAHVCDVKCCGSSHAHLKTIPGGSRRSSKSVLSIATMAA